MTWKKFVYFLQVQTRIHCKHKMGVLRTSFCYEYEEEKKHKTSYPNKCKFSLTNPFVNNLSDFFSPNGFVRTVILMFYSNKTRKICNENLNWFCFGVFSPFVTSFQWIWMIWYTVILSVYTRWVQWTKWITMNYKKSKPHTKAGVLDFHWTQINSVTLCNSSHIFVINHKV